MPYVTLPDRRALARKERNLHRDIHVTAENKHTLPPFGSLDSLWIMRSRHRNKGLWLVHTARFMVYLSPSNDGQKYFQKAEGNVLLDSYVVPANTYGLEMGALSEDSQCREGRRRLQDLRE